MLLFLQFFISVIIIIFIILLSWILFLFASYIVVLAGEVLDYPINHAISTPKVCTLRYFFILYIRNIMYGIVVKQ